ncbi:MAG: serine/threonine protein kinase [Myxococcales bacterium]|nr:serine/threonine protein kinase [Myxococcales bacterium]MCB9718144.1 serine/threonine protein kinase [Myxococcales bacterium]
MESDARELPRFIGRYEIEGEEAEGGMGHVYVARDPRVKRRVAVKLLKKLYSSDPGIRRRFEQEAEAVAALEHEAIVPVYDFGEHEGMLYIVMRYVGGGTLRDRIRAEQKLRLRDIASVIDRVASALGAAHARGLVHRDIKPANILFDEREVPYLSDFGVAKAAETIEETGTMMLGTPQYLSPEQAMGGEVDARSDVYSLGVVAFHAITGRPPFEAKNPMAMAMAHVMRKPPRIRELAPELPPVADEVFEQVLAKDPELRYQSAERFARDLRDLASGRWYLVKLSNKLGLATAPPTRPEPVAVPVPEPEPEPATGKARERQRTLPFRPRQVEHTLPDTSLRDFDDLDDLDEDETKLL